MPAVEREKLPIHRSKSDWIPARARDAGLAGMTLMA